MAQLRIGDQMPDFEYETPFTKGLTLAETAAKAAKTALVFLRYYGCTLCQYDMAQYAKHYGKLTANGGQLLVVLQSDPAALAQTLGRADALPFSVICDPEQKLYQAFAIEPAASMVKLADAKVLVKAAKATAAGFKHGTYEGNELQLTAAFVMKPARVLTYASYAKSGGDVPDTAELEKLLS